MKPLYIEVCEAVESLRSIYLTCESVRKEAVRNNHAPRAAFFGVIGGMAEIACRTMEVVKGVCEENRNMVG